MLQGHCTQVIVAMVTCQLYSSTVRPMFSHPEKTHRTTATSGCMRRNVRYDDKDLTDAGNEFQARAAATGVVR